MLKALKAYQILPLKALANMIDWDVLDTLRVDRLPLLDHAN